MLICRAWDQKKTVTTQILKGHVSSVLKGTFLFKHLPCPPDLFQGSRWCPAGLRNGCADTRPARKPAASGRRATARCCLVWMPDTVQTSEKCNKFEFSYQRNEDQTEFTRLAQIDIIRLLTFRMLLITLNFCVSMKLSSMTRIAMFTSSSST